MTNDPISIKPDPDLRARLDAFAFDEAGAAFPFSARLARERGWSRGFAWRVIEEYRRLLYLCCVAGREITPSEEVDAAWHLHLVYTRAYWSDLCANVLRQPLHHAPTSGGGREVARFREAYVATLAAYEQVFGAAPPADIWPDVETRFAPKAPAEFWSVPKAPFRRVGRFMRAKTLAVAGLLGATGVALAANASNGGGFISSWTIGGLMAIIFGRAIWRHFFPPLRPRNRKKGDGSGCGSSGCGSSGCSSSSSDGGGGSDGGSGCGSSGCGGGCGGGGGD